ncbi:MAG: HD domain-containing protein [Coriobacteriia bacterium]|nr:HD domain-containing protein [Coriobacteriia bacterium]
MIDLLEQAGFEAWCVGGFVRDAFRGAAVHDLDIATNAPWRESARVLRDGACSVHETGTAFGTITAVVDGNAIEVTTFRSDGTYRDARHPDSVTFVEAIEDDLARRDFTVNAMAYHPTRGLRDPFGGKRDLEAGLIRAVGEPEKRFREDALRILRGIRFASQLGFKIEDATLQAMHANAASLRAISAERVFTEIDRMLMGDHVLQALLACPDVIGQVLPEIAAMNGCPQNTPYHIYDVYEHTAHVVADSPATPVSRWAAFFHDVGKPVCRYTDSSGRDHFKGHASQGAEIARDALVRLKAPVHLRDDVFTLVRLHEWFVPATEQAVLRALNKLDGRVELYRALLALQIADSGAKAPGVTERLEAAQRMSIVLEQVLGQDLPFTVKQLAVNGGDLLAAGWVPGPHLGSTLDELLDAVMDGRVQNTREALLEYASRHCSI